MSTFPKYEDYEKLVYSAIHAVHRQIGGDLPEMLACSGMLFTKACLCYSDKRGMTIQSWIRKVVWDDTFAARRGEIVRSKYHEKGDVDFQQFEDGRSTFRLSEFLEDLSEDARNLAHLVLEPDGIALTKEGVPKKMSLIAKARRMYNWTDEQIRELFEEIGDAL